MPRNVRNFWIELEVDGKKEVVATGPRRRDGGFSMRIYLRSKGSVHDKPVYIRGHVGQTTGKLVLRIDDPASDKYLTRTEEP